MKLPSTGEILATLEIGYRLSNMIGKQPSNCALSAFLKFIYLLKIHWSNVSMRVRDQLWGVVCLLLLCVLLLVRDDTQAAG